MHTHTRSQTNLNHWGTIGTQDQVYFTQHTNNAWSNWQQPFINTNDHLPQQDFSRHGHLYRCSTCASRYRFDITGTNQTHMCLVVPLPFSDKRWNTFHFLSLPSTTKDGSSYEGCLDFTSAYPFNWSRRKQNWLSGRLLVPMSANISVVDIGTGITAPSSILYLDCSTFRSMCLDRLDKEPLFFVRE